MMASSVVKVTVGFWRKLDEIWFYSDVLFLEKPISVGHLACLFAFKAGFQMILVYREILLCKKVKCFLVDTELS